MQTKKQKQKSVWQKRYTIQYKKQLLDLSKKEILQIQKEIKEMGI